MPQAITDDDNPVIARPILFIKEAATEKRFDAQNREEACRDSMTEDVQRLAGASQNERPSPMNRHFGEDSILLFQVNEVWRRKRKAQRSPLRLRRPQLHNLIGAIVRQRSDQHGIDHAEDGGVGSDAERQRNDSHRSEAFILE